MKSSFAVILLFGLVAAIQAGYISNIVSSFTDHAKGTAAKIVKDGKQASDLIQGHVKEDIGKALTGDLLGTVQTIADNAFETSKVISDNAIDTAQKITSDSLDDAKVSSLSYVSFTLY